MQKLYKNEHSRKVDIDIKAIDPDKTIGVFKILSAYIETRGHINTK